MTDTCGAQAIGQPIERREDRRFLKGLGRYTDDIVVAGALHAHFVRSPYAHARLLRIDTSRARALEGVHGVFTAADIRPLATPLRMAPPIEGLLPVTTEPLAGEKVRFAGDPYAVVIADDRYLAEDAAELIDTEFEPLEPVAGFGQAMQPEAALVHEELGTNLVSTQHFSTPDLNQAFARAARVVTTRFSQQRQTHAPIETRGCIAQWDEGRQHLMFTCGNQTPHPLRTALAARLRLSESQVTVISPDIGGAFGQKIALMREELCVAALARKLRRPIRWREDRLENLTAACHAREESALTRAAVDEQGRILALELAIDADFGAYCFYPANYMARVVAMILTGPYRVTNYGYTVRVALTNKCPSGPMRAPMAITSWIMEGTIDSIARELSVDPLDVRLINTLRSEDLPFTMATGELLRDVTPLQTLQAAVRGVDYDEFRRRQVAGQREGRLLGLGLCSVIESTTYGSAFYRAAGIRGSGHDNAWVRIEPSGAVNASVGLMSSGMGYETAFAQTVADGLGVSVEAVCIALGHSAIAPYGMGARGSRGAVAGGGTLFLAARKLQDKVLAIAAHRLGVEQGSLRLQLGRVEKHDVAGWKPAGLTLNDIAEIAYMNPLALPPGVEPGLEIQLAWDPPPMVYSNATHACEVEVNVDSGELRILRYLVAEDAGTLINPLIVKGQLQGAVAMGLGGALMEDIAYDESAQPRAGSLADYLLPTATDLPDIEIIHLSTPNALTPVGIKGMAEGGVMGAIGAVCNAVGDALAHLGVTVDAQPLTPERVLDWIQQAKHTSAAATPISSVATATSPYRAQPSKCADS
jgi:carbon-monoxide dehydrogenase large subunit